MWCADYVTRTIYNITTPLIVYKATKISYQAIIFHQIHLQAGVCGAQVVRLVDYDNPPRQAGHARGRANTATCCRPLACGVKKHTEHVGHCCRPLICGVIKHTEHIGHCCRPLACGVIKHTEHIDTAAGRFHAVKQSIQNIYTLLQAACLR